MKWLTRSANIVVTNFTRVAQQIALRGVAVVTGAGEGAIILRAR